MKTKESKNKIRPLLVSAKEAASLCGISQSMWYLLMESKKIPKCIRLGKRRLWSLEKLEMWIRLNCPISRILESEIKKAQARNSKKAAEKLTDSYVKQVLCDHTILKHSDIPKELTELKRVIIKFNRFMKQKGLANG